MIWILASAICTIIYTTIAIKKRLKAKEITTAGILIVAMSIVIANTYGTVNSEYIRTESTIIYEIKSLKNETETVGSFFLGSGKIKNEPVYYFMTESENGIKIESISGKNIYIKEDGKNEIEEKKEIYDYKGNIWLGFAAEHQKGETITIIHVPKGTIIQEYKID